MQNWTIQDAKARFSELVNFALLGEPQLVTRHGVEAVVVVRAADYDALTTPRESIVDLMERSPHRDLILNIARSTDSTRTFEITTRRL